jgi:Flp pilus assembly protein TadG
MNESRSNPAGTCRRVMGATGATPGRVRPGRHPRRGNVTLELAISLGLLLSLTFGSIEFGYFFFVKNTLQGAAREGARVSVPPGATNAEVTAATTSCLTAAGFNVANFTIQIRNSTDTADVNVATLTEGTPVLVKVSGTWGTVGLRPFGLISASKPVIGTAVMRKEAT